ncbi:Mannosyl-oligosaccharide 1 [Diplonema papillatum]|nr:Mannosyl-oligosaccharide 1 [Diplonema papillatum]
MLRALLVLAALLAVASGEVASTLAETQALREKTHRLGMKVEKLTLEMQTILGEVEAAAAARKEKVTALWKTESADVEDLVRQTVKRAKKLAASASTLIEQAKKTQSVHNRQVMNSIKSKGCGPSHQKGSTAQSPAPRQDPNNYYGPPHRSAPRAGPPPDPCSSAGESKAGSSKARLSAAFADSGDGSSSGSAGEGRSDPAGGGAEGADLCKRAEVVSAIKTSWEAYKTHAWGWDELMPLSKRGKNWGKGVTKSFGLTIHDSLSTLWLAGLTEEFDDAVEWIDTEFDVALDFPMSTFESVIRMVGGLLSAYELSGEKHPALLKKAKAVADRLLHAFNTSTGIPHSTVNLATKQHGSPSWAGGSSVLSEFGTVQLEFRTLSFHLRDPQYDVHATWIMDLVDKIAPKDYLCPTYLSTHNARWTSDHITLGALGDSFFEYLLKQYLLTGKSEKRYAEAYRKAAQGIVKRLVQKPDGKKAYLAEFKRGAFYHKMDHLACFAAGMLALGVHELDRSPDESAGSGAMPSADIMAIAEELTETCYLMYHKTASGVSPEMVEFREGEMFTGGRASYYLLRPETAESFFYMWRLTKKQKYRDWGWDVYLAIKRWCQVESGGFTGVRNVEFTPPQQDDLMQSFFMAETLKYFYLLFASDDALDLTQWVLNTEAHPLRIRQRDPLDIWDSRIVDTRAKDLESPLDDLLARYSIASPDGQGGHADVARILVPYSSHGTYPAADAISQKPKKSRPRVVPTIVDDDEVD